MDPDTFNRLKAAAAIDLYSGSLDTATTAAFSRKYGHAGIWRSTTLKATLGLFPEDLGSTADVKDLDRWALTTFACDKRNQP